jgi:hypothetical protein
LPVELYGRELVIQHAQGQTDRPNANTTCRARLEHAHPRAADDAKCRNNEEGAKTEAKANKGASNRSREGENNATQLLADTEENPEGMMTGR